MVVTGQLVPGSVKLEMIGRAWTDSQSSTGYNTHPIPSLLLATIPAKGEYRRRKGVVGLILVALCACSDVTARVDADLAGSRGVAGPTQGKISDQRPATPIDPGLATDLDTRVQLPGCVDN